MRIVMHTSLIAVVMGVSAAMSGCAANEPGVQEDDVKNADVNLTATAEGPEGNLVMKGAPSDPNYVGVYPNPQKFTSIHFVLRGDGVPSARCVRDGLETVCTETPFFVEIKVKPSTGGVAVRSFGVPADAGSGAPPEESAPAPAPAPAGGDSTGSAPPPAAPASAPTPGPMSGGVTVEVTDVNGKVVAKKEVDSPPPTSPAPAPAGGGGAAPAPTAENTWAIAGAMGGSPGTGGFSKNGETQACTAAALGDTPGCDMTTVGAAAKVYCDAVNAQLPAADKIDCGALTSASYVPSALPASRSAGSQYVEQSPPATGRARR
jgi:hypothetical protein